MSVINPYITKLAREFWSLAGLRFIPGCDIIGAVNFILPVDIVSLSELSLCKVEEWFLARNIVVNIEADERLLHGFILTNAGRGIIFINGTDSEEERRYTVAHETAHFLQDYKIPRDKAIEKVGERISEVLDGLREPTLEERVDGLLGSVRVKPYSHLLEKNGDGSFYSCRIYDSENDADSLAVELLAPHSEVIRRTKVGTKKISFNEFRNKCQGILIDTYRLPNDIAREYAIRLSYVAVGPPSFMEKLGF
ncbi:MAG TPA: ImmA/IrrE family metallo-endopeptidase [Chitinophagaceae bacterium]|nr:ImmA/IrrE family metallo-endopeptidase [Chitinophagaceae bacterium]